MCLVFVIRLFLCIVCDCKRVYCILFLLQIGSVLFVWNLVSLIGPTNKVSVQCRMYNVTRLALFSFDCLDYRAGIVIYIWKIGILAKMGLRYWVCALCVRMCELIFWRMSYGNVGLRGFIGHSKLIFVELKRFWCFFDSDLYSKFSVFLSSYSYLKITAFFHFLFINLLAF